MLKFNDNWEIDWILSAKYIIKTKISEKSFFLMFNKIVKIW